MESTPPVDKSKINVTVYEINKNTQFHTYTATWCGPCQRIKPIVTEIMSKHNYKILSQEIIEKTVFKETVNEFVPFFVVMRYGDIFCPDGIDGCEVMHYGFKKVDSIQTSDQILLNKFLSNNGIGPMILDDDF
jgi:thiol-disulfide isomerase/thioredoxin